MTLDNKVPPPVVALVCAVAMWVLSLGSEDLLANIRFVGVFISWLIGMVFVINGLRAFQKANTTANPLQPNLATSLVVSGIYKITRNPMYVGVGFILLAWLIFLNAALPVLGVIGFVTYIAKFQIIPEERAMHTLFAEEYASYSKRVRRWL